MVFLVGHESEEFPGKVTNEIINVSSTDGFKIISMDGIFNVYTVGANGLERYIFTRDTREECIDMIAAIMNCHVTNEAHAVINIDEFNSFVEEIKDKEELIDIMLNLMRKHGYHDIADQYDVIEDEVSSDELLYVDEPEETVLNEDDRFTIEDEKFR